MSSKNTIIKANQSELQNNNESGRQLIGLNIEHFLAGHIANPRSSQQNMSAQEPKNRPLETESNPVIVQNGKW